MRSFRIVASHIDIDGIPIQFEYGDVFVVLREDGDTEPAPSDWEVQIRTGQFHAVTAARHELALSSVDGSTIRGTAIVRFSDGHRHLFRGDSALDGFDGTAGVDPGALPGTE